MSPLQLAIFRAQAGKFQSSIADTKTEFPPPESQPVIDPRDVEIGCLKVKLKAFQLENEALQIRIAELKNELIRYRNNGNATLYQIRDAVAAYYKISVAELVGNQKPTSIARPRQVFAYLAAKLTLCSLPQIGRVMRRDHTTVLHARDVTIERMQTNAQLASDIEKLTVSLTHATAS